MIHFVIRVTGDDGIRGYISTGKNRSAVEMNAATARKFAGPADAAAFWEDEDFRRPEWEGAVICYDDETGHAYPAKDMPRLEPVESRARKVANKLYNEFLKRGMIR